MNPRTMTVLSLLSQSCMLSFDRFKTPEEAADTAVIIDGMVVRPVDPTSSPVTACIEPNPSSPMVNVGISNTTNTYFAVCTNVSGTYQALSRFSTGLIFTPGKHSRTTGLLLPMGVPRNVRFRIVDSRTTDCGALTPSSSIEWQSGDVLIKPANRYTVLIVGEGTSSNPWTGTVLGDATCVGSTVAMVRSLQWLSPTASSAGEITSNAIPQSLFVGIDRWDLATAPERGFTAIPPETSVDVRFPDDTGQFFQSTIGSVVAGARYGAYFIPRTTMSIGQLTTCREDELNGMEETSCVNSIIARVR